MPPPKLNLFKYGMPLYGAAWPSGDIIFVVGGGGHGIKNRLVFARYRDGVLSDQIGEYNFGADCPTRLAVSPNGQHLIVAIGAGGLKAFELDSIPALCPNVVPLKGSTASILAAITGEVKVLQFNGSGDLLAVGYEDGSLSVYSWPEVEEQFSLKGDAKLKDAVRDIDFSPSHGDSIAAIVCQNGTCEVWDLREKRSLCKLQMQKELERPSFSKCRWSRDGTGLLFTLVNSPKGASIAIWDISTEGAVSMRLKQHALVTKQAGTAFGISPNGTLLGVGTGEGDVIVVNTHLRSVRKANKCHMVFTTDLAFSEASDAVLSVSADAGAHVLEVQKVRAKTSGNSGGLCSTLFHLLFILLCLLGALASISYLLEQPAVREVIPPEVLVHADRIKTQAHMHIRSGAAQAQEWWESEETQEKVEQAKEKMFELWEQAKPVAQKLLIKAQSVFKGAGLAANASTGGLPEAARAGEIPIESEDLLYADDE